MNWRTKYEQWYVTGKPMPVEEIKPEQADMELAFYLWLNDDDKALLANLRIGWKI